MKTKRKTRANKTRQQELGDFGEDRALQLLKKTFVIEKMPRNFPFFDLMAKRGRRKLLISVRTRNKFTAKGTLKKDAYNLYTKRGHYESAAKIATFFGAKIAWVAVIVNTRRKTFCAYMGYVSKLPSPRNIPMHPERGVPGHKCLARNRRNEAISESWSNIARTVRG